ncbi:MAG: hypothetical protein PHU49_02085 [Syntrophorhabdaceae bacterium]|nr:hypothetical protein [Syntrophorhabdaceae bacterium]MDD5242782.1 hypothetical protein [Syntrophorhabdaceae bacterium]
MERNSKPLKSSDLRKLEEENRKLKEVVLNQLLMITSLKKDELGLGPGRLMEKRKKEIIQFVQDQKYQGRTVTATIRDIKIKRSTYHSGFMKKIKAEVIGLKGQCNAAHKVGTDLRPVAGIPGHVQFSL